MINLDRSAAMIKTQEMVDTLSSVELETIDRVLKRLNERLLLRNIDKEDAGAVATTLYRCGFHTRGSVAGSASHCAGRRACRAALPGKLVSAGVAALLTCDHKDSCMGY